MRLFIAVNCGDETKKLLLSVQEKIKAQSQKGNFSRPENIHLTLVFLGETPEGQVPAICSVIKEAMQPPAAPLVEQIPFDFDARDYRLILVNTGGHHAELSGEYSSIPNEMKRVARHFSQDTLRGISIEDIAKDLPAIRSSCSDRAVMRAFHFIEENVRVDAEIAALKADDFTAFLRLINHSGNSSWNEYVDPYKQWMLNALQAEKNPIFIMSVRPYGVIRVI